MAARCRKGDKKNTSSKSQCSESYEPLMIAFLSCKSLKLRSGIEVGRKAVDYIRGQDFIKWVLNNKDLVITKFPDCLPSSASEKKIISTENIIDIGNNLIEKGFIHRVEDATVTSLTEAEAKTGGKIKWPTRLSYSKSQVFTPDSFYVISYEHTTSWSYFMLSLIILGIIGVFMFPAWPLYMKLTMWYIVVGLSTVMIVLVVLRLVFFAMLWFVGFDFWFLPNFFDEEAGIIDSFIPAYSLEYRRDTWMMVGVRVFAAVLSAAGVFQLGKEHSLGDISRFAGRQFLDVVDWGHQKLTAAPENSSVPVPLYDNTMGMQNEEDESIIYKCMIPCGFETFETIKEECIYDCDCMNALLDSHCFAKCPLKAKETLESFAKDACANSDETMY